MLVKIKKAMDGRWVIQVLGGEHYLKEVAIANAIYLRNARFGDRHITGTLYGSWEVEAIEEVVGTVTAEYLMVKGESFPNLPEDAFNFDNQWEERTGLLKFEEIIPHLTVNEEEIKFSRNQLRPVIKGVRLAPPSEVRVATTIQDSKLEERLEKTSGWFNKLRGK